MLSFYSPIFSDSFTNNNVCPTSSFGSFRQLSKQFDQLTKASSIWSPKVDVNLDQSSLTITAELPGLKKDDINIDIKNNVLTLTGTKSEKKIKDKVVSQSVKDTPINESIQSNEDKPSLEEAEFTDIQETQEKVTQTPVETKTTAPETKSSSSKHSEIFYGRFERSFKLPRDVDIQSGEAHHEDGVLTIKFIRKQPQSLKVQIQ
ncbi:hypothetical protein SAMD00019534_005030 [Acytostelium subglobosum LB1]|uniref:hypothetical protein n=1 Tax=Acytostelium subglobosum LB1 TaxID=1410327 RepID=UPI000644C791|nr:hypothetical protein SAMD00019534_005030 [Acytostelium subglobosum LB1]GAM17328.1 hypothetical protein SAMD00019534_005030 [Acytostelium subglobosum LB1]|eukprot:XP_012759390.1 hypothetical protein SAMD00019534_005030 [Acytostelium subglobosum LB1]